MWRKASLVHLLFTCVFAKEAVGQIMNTFGADDVENLKIEQLDFVDSMT